MAEDHLAARKNDHLNIVLDPAGNTRRGENGFATLAFEHCALPELHLDEIDLGQAFLGRHLRAPLLISSMTGGTERAARINQHLAEAAQALGIALGVGSQRVALEAGVDHGLTRQLRQLAPGIPLMGNIGGAQLIAGVGRDQARRLVDMLEADALIVHLNPLQEAVQPGGDRNWRGVLDALEALARDLGVPLVAKEVGAGISAAVARRLVDAGVAVIDVAGSGGTSWAVVEAQRARTLAQRQVAMAFANWGISTAQALAEVRRACPDTPLIASGGVRDGVDAAKAIRLGAQLAGQAAAALPGALTSTEAVIAHFEIVIEQLRVACFCTGSRDLEALRQAPLRPTGSGLG
ncbi:type 2 isopentenyl-diphosphate Delta-isomerase [Stutzerimonas tarimensis]|uniref:Isopentenyl-diphosphate delta-isomerase n=1 Tax=Stutzerimonas tarimensis TaxID=1507735 RepID=A0ABV7T2F2_9GAMM